ncbi:helix-turn-helix transcriptional regulator [Corynebacterium dentalis]|uniref:helix-turn-helix transcriptional regulator n=1 Tax=Corynebacterium dentalis TaxID=2014528 RepID=UPI0028A0F8BF|nr:helix-turn-helix transcriptional regulator [Corynebacterium dentalis]
MTTQMTALDAADVDIANRITNAMVIKNINALDLSDRTGISYGTLRRSLKGARSLTFQEFHKIGIALGVDKSALLPDALAGRDAA